MEPVQRAHFQWPESPSKKHESLFRVDKHQDHGKIEGRRAVDFLGIGNKSLFMKLAFVVPGSLRQMNEAKPLLLSQCAALKQFIRVHEISNNER